MKCLAVIPARAGSKGIPRKNVRLLHGRPLISYSIEAALGAVRLNRVLVSTEDAEIAAVARSEGAEVVERPARLAADDTPTLPVLQHAFEFVGGGFDVVVTLQPTSPLRTARHIDEAVAQFAADPAADSLVSVVRLPHSMTPTSLMKLGSDGYLRDYLEQHDRVLRRQENPVLYARNGAAIYITRSGRLSEYVFGGRTRPYFMDLSSSWDIDEVSDWQIVEALMHVYAEGSQ